MSVQYSTAVVVGGWRRRSQIFRAPDYRLRIAQTLCWVLPRESGDITLIQEDQEEKQVHKEVDITATTSEVIAEKLT